MEKEDGKIKEKNLNVEVLPPSWERCELQKLCEVITKGSTPTSYGYTYQTTGINFIKTENINGGGVIFGIKQFIDDKTNKFLSRSQLKTNDLLFSIAGTIGRVGIIRSNDLPANINQALAIIRLVEIGAFHKYIFYLLKSEVVLKKALKKIVGVGRANLSLTTVGEFIIPLPPLPEQHRIVSKIEELFSDLDNGIEQLKTAQQQLKVYRLAVLKWAFEGKLTEKWRKTHHVEPAERLLEQIKTERENRYQQQLEDWQLAIEEWETNGKQGKKPAKPQKLKKLSPLSEKELAELPRSPEGWFWMKVGEIAESMKNGVYKPKEFYNDDGIPCLRMYNIDNGKVQWFDIKRMNLSFEEIEEYELKPGDLLVNRVNSRELVGKTALITDNIERSVYESKNIRLQLLKEVIGSYLNYWFLINSNRYFNRNAQQTVGMASINQDQLGDMPFPICSKEEQLQIVQEIETRLSVCDNIETNIKEALLKSEALRQSILKKAFEGNLVPQDPNDEPASVLLERIKAEKAKQESEKKNPNNRKKENAL